jgi:hypothetical protein
VEGEDALLASRSALLISKNERNVHSKTEEASGLTGAAGATAVIGELHTPPPALAAPVPAVIAGAEEARESKPAAPTPPFAKSVSSSGSRYQRRSTHVSNRSGCMPGHLRSSRKAWKLCVSTSALSSWPSPGYLPDLRRLSRKLALSKSYTCENRYEVWRLTITGFGSTRTYRK